MSKLSFGIKLVDSNDNISQNVLRALLPDINKYFDKAYEVMKEKIPAILIKHIKLQPEYDSLLNGALKAEFGLPDSSSRVGSIISAIENSVTIQTKPLSISGKQLKGSIKIQMIQKDFSELLSLGAASFTTEKGSELNWLQWLLIEGDSVIIADYSFVLGSFPSSRTGMGIMRQFGGPSWRVPPEFAGSINSNWITRAIDSAAADIQNELQSIERIF